MGEEETVTVKIPKCIANWIENSEWIQLYDSLDDFVVESVRRHMERLMFVGK